MAKKWGSCALNPRLCDAQTPDPVISGQWGQLSIRIGGAGFAEGWRL